MTDNEIIKALKCCYSLNLKKCNVCSLKNNPLCSIWLSKYALDLINRQKAEYKDLLEQFRILDCECERLEEANEKQKAEIESLKSPSAMQIEVSKKLEATIKAEAVKEYAKRLKEKAYEFEECGDNVLEIIDVDDIDDTLKEMERE